MQDRIEAVHLPTIGLILMIVGAIGFVVGLFQEFGERRRYDRYDEPPPRDPRYR